MSFVDGNVGRCQMVYSQFGLTGVALRWTRSDEMGVVIVRQEGKGRGGSYVLKLTGLSAS